MQVLTFSFPWETFLLISWEQLPLKLSFCIPPLKEKISRLWANAQFFIFVCRDSDNSLVHVTTQLQVPRTREGTAEDETGEQLVQLSVRALRLLSQTVPIEDVTLYEIHFGPGELLYILLCIWNQYKANVLRCIIVLSFPIGPKWIDKRSFFFKLSNGKFKDIDDM